MSLRPSIVSKRRGAPRGVGRAFRATGPTDLRKLPFYDAFFEFGEAAAALHMGLVPPSRGGSSTRSGRSHGMVSASRTSSEIQTIVKSIWFHGFLMYASCGVPWGLWGGVPWGGVPWGGVPWVLKPLKTPSLAADPD